MTALFMVAAAACHAVAGAHITGQDLASAAPAFQVLAADADLGHAPMPGARRFFEPGELIRIAREHGFEVTGVQPVCFERPLASLTTDMVLAAMRKSPGMTGAQIGVTAISAFPAPHGELVFPPEGLAQPVSGDVAVWNGYVQYDGGRFTVWARVRITVHTKRVIATADLRPGHVIDANDVRVEEVDAFPYRSAMPDSLDAVMGHTVRRLLPGGKPVMAGALGDPNDVEIGDSVTVEVHSGAAMLRLEALAESSGRQGDTVSLRNSDGGKTFRAKVKGKDQAVVEAR